MKKTTLSGSRRQLKNTKGRETDVLSFLLVVPALAVIAFVLVIPVFYGIFVSLFDCSFTDLDIRENFIGLQNYIRMFQDETFLMSLRNTLIFAVFALLGDFVLGTLIAVAINSLSKRWGGIFRAVITIALLVSPIVCGLIFRYFFDTNSGWFYWLSGLTVEQFPGVAGRITAMFLCVLAHCWQTVPFVVIVLSAGLLTVPQDYYEASSIDGAGTVIQFFRITLPHLTNMYMVAAIISGVDTLKVYDIIYSLTNGGPMNSTISLSLYAYKRAYTHYELGYAMAVSIFTMLLCVLIFGIPFSKYNRFKHEEGGM